MPLNLHKNTLIVFVVLALIAVLLLGINIGRKIGVWQNSETSAPQPTVEPTLEPTPYIAPTATPEASESAVMEQPVYGVASQSAQVEEYASPSAIQE